MNEFHTDPFDNPGNEQEGQDLRKKIEELQAKNKELTEMVAKGKRDKQGLLEVVRGIRAKFQGIQDELQSRRERVKSCLDDLKKLFGETRIVLKDVFPALKDCPLKDLPSAVLHELSDLQLSNDLLMDYFTNILPGFKKSGTRFDSAEAIINYLEALWAKQREFAKKASFLMFTVLESKKPLQEGNDPAMINGELGKLPGITPEDKK
jgi:hypothetical protein